MIRLVITVVGGLYKVGGRCTVWSFTFGNELTIMDLLFYTLLLSPLALCSPRTYCGECDCFPQLSFPPIYMICQGLHVSRFPELSWNIAEHLREIHLYSTLILELPEPEAPKFMRLEQMIERSNNVLDCDTMKTWMELMPYCNFDSECLNRTDITTLATTTNIITSTTETIPHTTDPSNTMVINILLAITVIALAVVSVSLAPCRRGSGRGRWRGARYPRGPCQCTDDTGVLGPPAPSAPREDENTGFEMDEFSCASNDNHYEME